MNENGNRNQVNDPGQSIRKKTLMSLMNFLENFDFFLFSIGCVCVCV